jgi:predicted dehydrogenase/threonine dehydrogenase-like Zn-dependent dehydrogenase
MKQLFLKIDDGEIISINTIDPVIKDNHVIVRTIFSAVSAGTERSLSSFGNKNLIQKAITKPDQMKEVLQKITTDGLMTTIEAAFNRLKDPMPMGYSGVGEVIEVGKGVTNIHVGDIVSMVGQAYHSELNRVNKNLIAKIPNNEKSYKQYALCALGGIALQGIHQIKIVPGEIVAVIGLGLLGNITARILDAYGCDVIGYDIAPKNMQGTKLKEFIISNDSSAIETTLSLTHNRGVDKVIITAATSSNDPMDLAAKIVRDRGIICMIGVTNMEIDRKPYYDKELTFTIARSYGPGRYDENYEIKGIDYPIGYVRFTEGRNIEEFVRLVSNKRINLDDLITHVYKFEDFNKAYELINTNKSKEKYIGVLLEYKTNNIQNRIEIKKEFNYKKKALVNIGLIGAGNFARSTIIPKMIKSNKYYFKALATTGGVSTSQALFKRSFEYATNNYKELLEDSDIELIVISTPHHTHAKLVIEALRHNKSVYCEKPLCISSDELSEIKKAYLESKGHLFVGLNRRFAPLIKQMVNTLKNNNAKIIDITVNAGYIPEMHWTQDESQGGGRIIGEAIHFVDLAQHIDGSSILKINVSYIQNQGNPSKDNAIINITFESGSICNIIYTSMGNKRFPKETIKVFSGGKTIKIENFIKYYDFSKLRILKKTFYQDKGVLDEYNYIYNVLRKNKEEMFINDIFNNHDKLINAIHLQTIKNS